MSELARTRSVCVLGGGIAAFAAAAAFRRALPDAEVTVFAGGMTEPEYAGAATPYIHHFHRLLGIDPEMFRRRTGSVTVREAEVRRTGRPAFRLVPVSEVPYVDGAALHQLWLRWTMSDPSAGPAWSEVAQRARRQEDLAQGLGERFGAEAYLAMLGDLAAHLGVKIARETANSRDLADSFDLVIETDEREGQRTDWQRVEGVPGNWRWSIRPTQRPRAGTVETLDMVGEGVSWDAGAWRATAALDAETEDAGRIAVPWRGNVLAVGRAAVQCETFDGQPLAVALAGIVRALELLPRPGASARETAEYNRRSGAVHDFLLDWAAERWGAADTLPAGLSALRGQFAHRGSIPFRDEDPVPAGQWIGWLLGSGERPGHIDFTAMALSEERLATVFAGF